MSQVPTRPCLALPFTVIAEPGRVLLVAGEDFRYTLEGPGLDAWLPSWLGRLDGSCPLDELLSLLPEPERGPAREILERLVGERVILAGPVALAPACPPRRLVLHGKGELREALEALVPTGADAAEEIHLLCQSTLDYHEALDLNSRFLQPGSPWLWLSTGPVSRAYVSPVFLPDVGPCLACLLGHFEYLSPAPEIYRALVTHAVRGGQLEASPFPPHGLSLLAHLALWKVELLSRSPVPGAAFQLHVLDAASLEVSAHRVLLDPECPACRGMR